MKYLLFFSLILSVTSCAISFYALYLNFKLRKWYHNKVKELESMDYAVVILRSQIPDFYSWRDAFPDKSDLQILKMLIRLWVQQDEEAKENVRSGEEE
jgi:hypothetical protein